MLSAPFAKLSATNCVLTDFCDLYYILFMYNTPLRMKVRLIADFFTQFYLNHLTSV